MNTIKDKKVVLLTDFINAYDKWAREHGYDILGTVRKLGELQSEILNKEIQATTRLVINIDTGKKSNKHGVIFFFKELCNIRGITIEGQEEKKAKTIDEIAKSPKKILNETRRIINKLIELFEDNETNVLEMDSVLQIIEMEEDFRKEFVEKVIKSMAENGSIEINNGKIKLIDHNSLLLDIDRNNIN